VWRRTQSAGKPGALSAHSLHAKALLITAEADRFRNYDSIWRDWLNVLMEMSLARGNYGASVIAFPKRSPEAVQAKTHRRIYTVELLCSERFGFPAADVHDCRLRVNCRRCCEPSQW
jgi:hypothetical protein